ncbi:MAG: hypothetical protein ABI036_20725 [Fibrobacteria bacterium]
MYASNWKTLCMSCALAISALGTQGCYIYSAFQGARTLEEGRYSVSPSASVVTFSNNGESRWMTSQFGLQGGVGLGNGLELQSRYERVEGHYSLIDDMGYNYLDVALKYGLIKDKLAIGMPIGFMFGENVDEGESWQLHPSLYLTFPAARFLDINFSTTGLYFLNDSDDHFLLAFSGGLGIRPGEDGFTLMPEVGILTDPGEDGHFWHWGLGASMEF